MCSSDGGDGAEGSAPLNRRAQRVKLSYNRINIIISCACVVDSKLNAVLTSSKMPYLPQADAVRTSSIIRAAT
jgi:hypothetical protein